MELLLTRHTLLPDRTLGTLQIGQPCKPLGPSPLTLTPNGARECNETPDTEVSKPLPFPASGKGLGIEAVSTLEPHRIDWQTQKKTLGKTAIPEGRYLIRLTWSARYKRLMPFLQDVPHFAGIMIHPGNTPADTLGCILVGALLEGGSLLHSRTTFNRLYALFEQVSAQGEDIYITVCTRGQGVVMAHE